MINLERIEAELEALRIEIRELSKSTDADAALMITRLKAQVRARELHVALLDI